MKLGATVIVLWQLLRATVHIDQTEVHTKALQLGDDTMHPMLWSFRGMDEIAPTMIAPVIERSQLTMVAILPRREFGQQDRRGPHFLRMGTSMVEHLMRHTRVARVADRPL